MVDLLIFYHTGGREPQRDAAGIGRAGAVWVGRWVYAESVSGFALNG